MNNYTGLLDKAARQQFASVLPTETSSQAPGLLSVFVPTPSVKELDTIALNNTFTFAMNNTFTSYTNRLLVTLFVLLGAVSVSFAQEASAAALLFYFQPPWMVSVLRRPLR